MRTAVVSILKLIFRAVELRSLLPVHARIVIRFAAVCHTWYRLPHVESFATRGIVLLASGAVVRGAYSQRALMQRAFFERRLQRQKLPEGTCLAKHMRGTATGSFYWTHVHTSKIFSNFLTDRWGRCSLRCLPPRVPNARGDRKIPTYGSSSLLPDRFYTQSHCRAGNPATQHLQRRSEPSQGLMISTSPSP